MEWRVLFYFFAHISATPAPIRFKLFSLPAHIFSATFHVGFMSKKFFFHIKNLENMARFRRNFSKTSVLRPYLFFGPYLFLQTSYTYWVINDEHFDVWLIQKIHFLRYKIFVFIFEICKILPKMAVFRPYLSFVFSDCAQTLRTAAHRYFIHFEQVSLKWHFYFFQKRS